MKAFPILALIVLGACSGRSTGLVTTAGLEDVREENVQVHVTGEEDGHRHVTGDEIGHGHVTGDEIETVTVTVTEAETETVAVKFGVERIGVQRGDYDSFAEISKTMEALIGRPLEMRERYARPDLRWTVERGGEEVFASETQNDSYDAVWEESTPWFSAAKNEAITLRVIDVDIVDDDEIARFTLTLDELERHAREGRPLASSKVTGLVLGGVKRR